MTAKPKRSRSKRPRSIRGVLLDIDGTLIDSNDAHAKAWLDVLDEFGYDIPFDRVRPLIGMGGDKVLPSLIGISKESDEGKRLSERRTEIFTTRYLPQIQPFPKVRDLLRRMRRDGLTIVVATSAQDDELEGLLAAAGVADLIEETTTSSDAEGSKPDPDIVHAALDRGRLEPDDVLMLGDTPYDVEAAAKAEVRVVALRCGGWWSDADLVGALAIYDDPADLLAQYDESPFHPRRADRPADESPARAVEERSTPPTNRAPTDSRAS